MNKFNNFVDRLFTIVGGVLIVLCLWFLFGFIVGFTIAAPLCAINLSHYIEQSTTDLIGYGIILSSAVISAYIVYRIIITK